MTFKEKKKVHHKNIILQKYWGICMCDLWTFEVVDDEKEERDGVDRTLSMDERREARPVVGPTPMYRSTCRQHVECH